MENHYLNLAAYSYRMAARAAVKGDYLKASELTRTARHWDAMAKESN